MARTYFTNNSKITILKADPHSELLVEYGHLLPSGSCGGHNFTFCHPTSAKKKTAGDHNDN